ncbi:MAG: glycosyltransferase family 4 protein [Planctomycetes bacterium]|nr:glycosyltransferase family 4 protein [Planctomycetota bacterium]
MTAPRTVVWQGHPHAPAPLATIFRRRGANGSIRVVDDAGDEVAFGPVRMVIELLRWLWLQLVDLELMLLAAIVSRRRAPPPREGRAGTGPIVLVLPVLPDLSHTFVYREVLAVLRQRPDWRVVALRRNPSAPRHGEAAELERHVTWLLRSGITRRWLRVLRWLIGGRGGRLFSLYRAEPAGSLRDLLGKNPLRNPSHPGNAFELADLLAPLQPRAIHVYGSTYAANVAMGAALLLELPFSISSYVDFEFPYDHKMLAAKVHRARFCRVVTDHCRDSLMARDELRALPAAHFPTVYLGLDLTNWRQQAQPTGAGILVSAARLVPKKGLHLLPPALAALRARGVPCRWRVIGDGPEREVIAAAAGEHGVADLVDFLGPLDSAAVRAELLTADVAVLPCVVAADGERDGIPVFLIEAMALGVPVVSTPISGIPELVRDGDTGFLCAPGCAAALADTLQRVLSDRERTRRVAARGRDEVHATLDVDARARELIELIERVDSDPAPV